MIRSGGLEVLPERQAGGAVRRMPYFLLTGVKFSEPHRVERNKANSLVV